MAPVHCVIIHEGPVALQVELAESKHTQSYKWHSEHQSKQRVWSTTAFCNTAKKRQKHIWASLTSFSWTNFPAYTELSPFGSLWNHLSLYNRFGYPQAETNFLYNLKHSEWKWLANHHLPGEKKEKQSLPGSGLVSGAEIGVDLQSKQN